MSKEKYSTQSEHGAPDAHSKSPPYETVMELVFDWLADHGCRPRWSRGHEQISACCPAHDDRRPSLSVGLGGDGKVLFYCHAGCSHIEIREVLGLGNSDPFHSMPRDRTRSGRTESRSPLPSLELLTAARMRLSADEAMIERLEAERGWRLGVVLAYGLGLDADSRIVIPVHDVAGELLTVEHYRPFGGGDVPKSIAMRGRGRELLLPPSRLLADVFVCEGLSDAIAATSAGLCAVGAPSATIWKPSYSELLAANNVTRAYLIGDCDEAGRGFTAAVAESLAHVGIEALPVDLAPDRNDGFDLTDYILRGVTGGLEDGLLALTKTSQKGRRVTGARAVVVESFASIRAERTRWLWAGRIPLGAPTLLVGREKLGKSTLTNELAARLSRGELVGDLEGKPADTLIVSYEDHAGSTVKPRLLAAGADPARVHRLRAEYRDSPDLVSLPEDVERIAQLARQYGARLLIVDPFSASLGTGVDSHRDQDVRRTLAPLAQLAEDAELAVLLLAHFNKAQGGDSLSRVLGSRGLTAAVRSVLVFGRAPDAEDGSPDRVLAHAACNLAREAPSLSCHVEPRTVEDEAGTIETSRLVIGEACDLDADALLATRSDDDRTDRGIAAEWLADNLADGVWKRADEIKARAKAEGIAERTLHRARKLLGVEHRRDGFPAVSEWRLAVVPPPKDEAGTTVDGTTEQTRTVEPNPADADPQLCQVSDNGTTGANGAKSEGAFFRAETEPDRERWLRGKS